MEFETHHNGSRPFKVIIESHNYVSVYRNETNELLLNKKVNKIFIGKSIINKMTKFSGGYGNDFKGNSFLFELDDHTYQHVGCNIFTFNSYNKIIKYVSPVGNNDVPYPYAIDSEGNIYLLIEDVVLINTDQFKRLYTSKFDDPYDYYYNHTLITEDFGIVPPKIPEIKKINEFKDYNKIKEYYHNDERYTLRYHPNPENYYKDNDQVYIIYENNEQKYLTKEEYIKLHENYGMLIDFRKLLNIEIQYD
jgi:hypothetical protein